MGNWYSEGLLLTQYGNPDKPYIKIPAILIQWETAFHIYEVLIRKNGNLEYRELRSWDQFRIDDGDRDKKKDRIQFVQPFHVDFLLKDKKVYGSHILDEYTPKTMRNIIRMQRRYGDWKDKILDKYNKIAKK